MTLAELVPLILKISIATLVFTIGLGTAPHELTYLLRKPGQLIRSLVSMNLVMLVVAVVIVKLFPLHQAVKIVLVALALSPVPPLLPKRLVRAGGGHEYVMALLCSAAFFAVIWIPLASGLLGRLFPAELDVPLAPVVQLVLLTVLGPTVAGVVVRALAPKLAARVATPLELAAVVLLLAGAVLILIKLWPAMLAQIGDGTLLAIIAFVLVGLVSGYLFGGPASGDRTVLGLATAMRHPAIAMTIAHAAFPTEKAVPAMVLLYLLTGTLVTVPYVQWRKKAHAREQTPPAATPAR